MSLIQCLAEGFADGSSFVGQAHRFVMDCQVVKALRVDEAAHELGQLGRAQAGADDRTMEMGGQLSQADPLMRGVCRAFRAVAVVAATAAIGLRHCRAGRRN